MSDTIMKALDTYHKIETIDKVFQRIQGETHGRLPVELHFTSDDINQPVNRWVNIRIAGKNCGNYSFLYGGLVDILWEATQKYYIE